MTLAALATVRSPAEGILVPTHQDSQYYSITNGGEKTSSPWNWTGFRRRTSDRSRILLSTRISRGSNFRTPYLIHLKIINNIMACPDYNNNAPYLIYTV